MRNLIAVVMVVGGLLLLAIGGSLEAEEPLELNLFKNGAAQEATREPVIETYGTIHSAGVYVLNAPDADLLHEEVSATLRYRQEGQTEWREGLPLVKLYGGRFAGSIFHLEPATTYEVQAVLKDENDIEIKTLAGTVKTRSNEVVYGKGRTLRVGKNEEFKSIQAAVKEAGPGDMVLITAGTYYESIEEWPRSGKPGAPIVIRGEKGAVLDSADPKFVETGKGY